MPQHKEYALAAASCSFFWFLWNVFTPSNPDHDLNLITLGALALVFGTCYFMPQDSSQAIQIISLGTTSILPLTLNEPFFGMVIGVFTLILLYAYNGYKTRPIWKLFISFAGTYVLTVIAISHFSTPSPESMARAFIWNTLTWAFLLFIWRVHSKILEHVMSGRLAELSSRLEKQNQKQLSYIRELIERCENAERQR